MTNKTEEINRESAPSRLASLRGSPRPTSTIIVSPCKQSAPRAAERSWRVHQTVRRAGPRAKVVNRPRARARIAQNRAGKAKIQRPSLRTRLTLCQSSKAILSWPPLVWLRTSLSQSRRSSMHKWTPHCSTATVTTSRKSTQRVPSSPSRVASVSSKSTSRRTSRACSQKPTARKISTPSCMKRLPRIRISWNLAAVKTGGQSTKTLRSLSATRMKGSNSRASKRALARSSEMT